MSQQTKDRLHAIAQERQVTESALLKRLVENALLQTLGVAPRAVTEPVEPVTCGARLYVRLLAEDHLLLRERATGRGMAAATYVSLLLRTHLRSVPPIPDRELAELKRSVAALGAIGRNINQIARVAHHSGRATGPGHQELMVLFKVCEGLRDHVKALIKANFATWESGHAAPPSR